MPDPIQPDPIPWWQSPTLRAVVVAMVPAVAFGVKAAAKVEISEQFLTDLVFALCGGIGGVVILIRRLKAGKDPNSPAPEIKKSII